MTARSDEGSSTSREIFSYQVFLSFRGEDVRTTFISHLLCALEQRVITTFYDDNKLPRGKDIQSKLHEAIETSKMYIVTFSPTYPTSRWCLDELVKIMECNGSNGHIMLPVFYGVEPTHLRYQSKDFKYKDVFDAHEVRFKNELERVNKWKQALTSAADQAGFCLQNQANGNDAKLVKLVIKEVVKQLDVRQLSIPNYMVGAESLVERVTKWLKNGSSEVEVGVIFGLGGVGKTTAAKVVYNNNCYDFESSSFLAGVRNASQKDNDFIQLQEQLVRNILRDEDEAKIYSIHEGKERIRRAIGPKKILVVLDDVDDASQFNEMFDCGWFCSGSKILITTRNEHLLKSVDVTTSKFKASLLTKEKSTELFCHHAFSQNYPPHEYLQIANLFIKYCGRLPLALEVLASSLRNNRLEMWELQYRKLKDFPNKKVNNILRLSYDSIEDRNDQEIFLHVAFFMVGKKKSHASTILDGCGLHGMAGLENLIHRSLLSVDKIRKTLLMHNLIQQMGYGVVREKAPDELGQRSRLLDHNETSKVLHQNMGTSAVKGLRLDFPNPSTATRPSNKCICKDVPNISRPIETSAFAKMSNLDLVILENVQLLGNFKELPKTIKWLSWRAFPLKTIPSDFALEELVALDMRKSCLEYAWEGNKNMWALKVLNLSHSRQLLSTPDLSSAPNVEWISVEGCTSLVKLHESIERLGNLTHLNLTGCVGLKNLQEILGILRKHSKLNLKGRTTLLSSFIIKKPSSLLQLDLHELLLSDPKDASVVCSCLSMNHPNVKLQKRLESALSRFAKE